MSSNLNNSFYGLIIGLVLAINDVISFGITKEVFLGINFTSLYWLGIPIILYGCQIVLFYYGLTQAVSMSILNISWNLFSNIIVTLVGLYFFQEDIGSLKSIALLFAFFSISIFTIDGLISPK